MRFDVHTNHRLLFCLVFVAFVAVSLTIAIGPALWVNDHNAPLSGTKPMTSDQLAGLRVYVDEGCPYCHTQQVRPLAEDKPFGRPSVPGDYARLRWLSIWQQPAMILGTERTGPDLSNVAARQPSATWQYMHLYQPRSVVPASVMPAFPWLFTVSANPGPNAVIVPVPQAYAPSSGKVVATRRAQELLAYLLSLKQAPLPASASGRSAPAASASARGNNSALGVRTYRTVCVACHQANGRGLSGAFPSLAGDPVVNAVDPTQQIRIVLFGLHGKSIRGVTYAGAMPSWAKQLSDSEIAAVINHERTSWGNHAPVASPAQVAAIRKTGAAHD